MLGAKLRVLTDSIYDYALEQSSNMGLPPDMLPIVMDSVSKRLDEFAFTAMAAKLEEPERPEQQDQHEENESEVDDGEHPAGD